MNRDVSTGPLARPFTHLLILLTHSLAPHCLLHKHTPLRSFVRSLTHFQARGKVNDWMAQNQAVLNHSARFPDLPVI